MDCRVAALLAMTSVQAPLSYSSGTTRTAPRAALVVWAA
jgi:hypothetical protein